MTNDEQELVEMMVWDHPHVTDKTMREIASLMLSIVKANIGKIAEVCQECNGNRIKYEKETVHLFLNQKCEPCKGLGITLKGK